MAIGKKTGGRDFQKGNKYSLGRPKLPEDMKSIALISKDLLKRTIFKYLDKTPIELEKIFREVDKQKAIDLIIIKFIFEALKGDHYKAEWLMVRSVGRVTTEEDPAGATKTAHQQLIEYLRERNVSPSQTN